MNINLTNKSNLKLLAIDTSTEHFSVCYYNDGKFLDKNILGDAKSSSYILQMINEVANLDNLDGIISTTGPGAFTGIRVGIGVVCGISLAKNLPTLGFSTLELIEFGAKLKFNTDKVISSLDARMSEIYLRKDSKNILIKPEDFNLECNEYIGVGTGFTTYGNFSRCKKTLGEFYPKAKNLIKLALNNLDNFTTNLPEPLYLRNNIAKKSTK